LLNIFSNCLLNDVLAPTLDYLDLDLTAFVAVSLKQSHNGNLADKAGHRSDLLRSLVLVHESGRTADERLVRFDGFTWATHEVGMRENLTRTLALPT
jgi:hypothetical protein